MKKCSYCGKEYPDDASICAIDAHPLQSVVTGSFQGGNQQTTTKQLSYIAPLRAGLVLGVLYALLGLIFVPFILLATILSSRAGAPAPFGGVFFAILIPLFYAIGGFIGGIIAAAIYNLVAKWTGGLEFRVRDVPTR